jgi:ankyrin repeat protein
MSSSPASSSSSSLLPLSAQLSAAFASRDVGRVLFLVREHGCSPDHAEPPQKNTPLILAARAGDEEAVADLLSGGGSGSGSGSGGGFSPGRADPYKTNASGCTPLMAAAAAGFESVITLLLLDRPVGEPRGRLLFARDHKGKTALDWARIARRWRCARTLELATHRQIEHRRDALREEDRKEGLRLLVEENRARRQLIDAAIWERNAEAMRELARPLDRAELKWDADDRVMTLSWMEFEHQEEAARAGIALANKAAVLDGGTGQSSLFDKNKSGPLTGLHPAAVGAAHHATASATSRRVAVACPSRIMVGVASKAAFESAVEEISQDGGRWVAPSFQVPRGRGSTSIAHDGSTRGSSRASSSSRSTHKNNNKTRKDLVAEANFVHMYLTDKHVLFADHEAKGGTTPLLYAAGADEPELITLLVRRAGADVNMRSKRLGHSPLTWAACSGALASVTALLAEGAELERPNAEGSTALMVACAKRHKGMVASLIEKSMNLALRRAARESDDQYDSLIRVMGHERASQARYSEAGKDSEGWQAHFDEIVFGTKDQHGRTALTYAESRDTPQDALILDMLKGARKRIQARYDQLKRARWLVEPIKCELCGNWEKRNRMEKHTMFKCSMRPLRCRFCNDLMPAKDLDEHMLDVCERRMVACEQGCGKELESRHLAAHMNTFCKRRIVLCRLECGCKCRFDRRTQHEVDDCPLRHVECPDCNADMLAKDLNQHLYHLCPRRLVFCGRGCGHRCAHEDVAFHENNECLLRPLPCRYAHLDCKEVLAPPDKREVHELHLCPKRPVPCKLGACQHVCRAEEMEHHVTHVCLYRRVKCANECGALILAKDREPHERAGETGLCPNRPTRCRRDWVGNRLRVKRSGGRGWDEGIVVGFEDVKVAVDDEYEERGKDEDEDEEGVGDRCLAKDDADGAETKTKKKLTKLLSEAGSKKKGEGSSSRLKVRFSDTTEWVNVGASYNHQSIEEVEGDSWACDWVPALHRNTHEACECGHRMVTCTLGCNQQLAAMHLKNHESERCPYRTVICPQGCGMDVPLKQLADHRNDFCIKRIVECDQCEHKMAQDLLFEHMRVDCEMHRVRCPNACPVRPRRCRLEKHLAESCSKRIVDCKWGCGAQIFADASKYHETKICPQREEPCKDCGTSVLFFMMKDHLQNHCGKRIITCSLCAKVKVMAEEEETHQSNFCPRRLYQCYLGCFEWVAVEDREKHEGEDCMRRIRKCTLGCGRIIRADLMQRHVDHNCRRRIVGCPHGCDEIVRAEDRDRHGSVCGMRPLTCGAGSNACCRRLRQWTRMVPIDAPFPYPKRPPPPPSPQTREERARARRHAKQRGRLIWPFSDDEDNGDLDGSDDDEAKIQAASLGGDLMKVERDAAIEAKKEKERLAAEEAEIEAEAAIVLERRVLVKCDVHGSTGLHQAATMGDLDLVRVIVGGLSKEDIDWEDPEDGTTALMRASFYGHSEIAQILVENGASIDLENSRGRTAMMDAVMNNHPGVVYTLMMLGGNYKKINRYKQRALDVAVKYQSYHESGKIGTTGRRTFTDMFARELTVMDLVTELDRLRMEHRRLLIAISCEDMDTVHALIDGGEPHRHGHIHMLYGEKPFLEELLEDSRANAEYYRSEMESMQQTTEQCHGRVRQLRQLMRENKENQSMVLEEEGSWNSSARENQEKVVNILRGLSAMDVASIISLGRRPPKIVQVLLKALCILRGMPPTSRGFQKIKKIVMRTEKKGANDDDDEVTITEEVEVEEEVLDYIGPAHALLTNRQLLRFLRQYDPSKHATASPDVIEALGKEILYEHPHLEDEISALPEHYPLLYALASWIMSCLFLNRRTKALPGLALRMRKLINRHADLDHTLAPNLMQQRFLTKELQIATESHEEVKRKLGETQRRYEGLDRMIWVTRLLQYRDQSRHSALSWACARHKASEECVQVLIDNGGAIDTTTEEEQLAATLIQRQVRHLHWMKTRGMWTPARAHGFRMKEMAHMFGHMRMVEKMRKERQTTRIPLAEAVFAGNIGVAELLIESGTKLYRPCQVLPAGHAPWDLTIVPLSEADAAAAAMGGRKKRKKKKQGGGNTGHDDSDGDENLGSFKAVSLASVAGMGEDASISSCRFIPGPVDCHMTLFEPPVSYMTLARLGCVMRQGRSEMVIEYDQKTGTGGGWCHVDGGRSTGKHMMSHHRAIEFAYEKIQRQAEELRLAEEDRQRRLLILEQVDRQQRIGRRRITEAVHKYDFAEALRLVDEEEIAIDTETLWGYTALGLAASEGSEGINDEGKQVLAVEILLDRPAGKIRPQVNRQTNGMTPLMWACNNGHLDVAESLLERGAFVDFVSSDPAPAHILPPPGAFAAEAAAAAAMVTESLHRLVRSFPGGSTAEEKAIIEAAAEEIKNAAAKAKMTKAKRENRVVTIRVLEAGEDSENMEDDGASAIEVDDELVEDSLYQTQKTALILATCAGHKKMVWLLLQYGADQSWRDSTGRNALEWACALGNHDLMQLLSQSRANFFGDARAKEGRASFVACRNGCGARLAPKLLDKHEDEDCPKRFVECPYAPCGTEELWAEEIPAHKPVCPNRPTPCPNPKCGKIVPLLGLERHLKEECESRIVPCPFKCDVKDLRFRMLDIHCTKQCKMRPVECSNHCGETISFCEVFEHKRTCLRRIVRCLQYCDWEGPFEDRAEHHEHHCPKRIVQCRWQGNGCEGVAKDRQEHHEENTCDFRMVHCECSKDIMGRDLRRHLKDHCIKRIISCRHRQCKMRFPYKDRAEHEKKFCEHRWVSCRWIDVSRGRDPVLPKEVEMAASEAIAAAKASGQALTMGKDPFAEVKVELGPDACELEMEEWPDESPNIDNLEYVRTQRVVGCGARVRLSEMKAHWEKHCAHRLVKCGSGCGVAFTAACKDHHAGETCQLREVKCDRCFKKVTARDLEAHLDRECRSRKVYCSLGCGEIVVENRRKRHEKEECLLRKVMCPNNCQEEMRYEDLAVHLESQCQNREYRPPSIDYECQRCSFQNIAKNMIADYGEDVFEWKCQVCKQRYGVKGMSVQDQLDRKFGKKGAF